MPKIPARADIAAAVALHAQIQGNEGDADLAFDAGDVVLFSAAMAQLLLVCDKSLARVTLTSVPSAVREDLITLGLAAFLEKWESHA